jgi:phenylacetate-CoA ligase
MNNRSLLGCRAPGFPARELQEVLNAATRSPFYGKSLTVPKELSLRQWRQMPLTTKEDCRSQYPLGMLAQPMSTVASYHESSGTSGEPSASFFTEDDWQDICERFLRSRLQLTPYDVLLIKTPYALVTTAHQMQRAAQMVGATVIPADNRSHNMPYSKVIRLLKDLKVSVTWSLPTETLIWAEAAETMGLNPSCDFPSLRALFVAGEKLAETKREYISKTWGGVDVIQDYGSTETGSLAGECAHGQMHFWADRLYPEIFNDKTGQAYAEGEGSLVVTPLFRQAMPLVRYHTGDRVILTYRTCQCGLDLPTIKVIGRESDFCSSVHEKLEGIIYQLPRPYRLRFWRAKIFPEKIEMEIAAGAAASETLTDEIACKVYAETGRRLEVSRLPVSRFLTQESLIQDSKFRKPKYTFAGHEDWDQGLPYV